MRSYKEIVELATKIRDEEKTKMGFQLSRRMYETFTNEELQLLMEGDPERKNRLQNLTEKFTEVKAAALAKGGDDAAAMEEVFAWLDTLPEEDIMHLTSELFGGGETGDAIAERFCAIRSASMSANTQK